MALSVREALADTALKYGKLLAGEAGVENSIKWVTIVEVLEDVDRLAEGELLVTTAYGLAGNPDQKAHYMENLARRKLAGVVIATGFYLPEISMELLEQADKHNLPLIEIPSFLNFSDITRSILQKIVQSQYELLDFSESVHHELLQLLLSSKGFPYIAELLAARTGGSISIYSLDWEQLAHQAVPALPDLSTYEDQIVTAFRLNETRTAPEQPEITCFESLSDTVPMVNTFAPITADDQVFGHILLIKPYHDFTELDRISVGHAAMVCALEFLRIKAIEETEWRMQEGFLEEILAGKWTKTSLIMEKGKLMGFDFSKLHNVMILKFSPTTADPGEAGVREDLYKLYEIAREVFKGKQIKIFSQLRYNSLVLLLEGTVLSREETTVAAQQISAIWNTPVPTQKVVIGLGNNRDSIDQLFKCAEEAELALKFGHFLKPCHQVCFYSDLGIFHWLIESYEQKVDLRAMCDHLLGRLLEYDRKHGNQLIDTLETYLSYNQNLQQTAGALFIHRHTLKYRLKRIEAKTGLDLKNHHHRLQLQLAIYIHKFLYAVE